MKQENSLETLTNEQIIALIYKMVSQKQQPLNVQRIGNYGLVSSGQKSFHSGVKKVLRKTLEDHATPDDIINETPVNEIIDRDYTSKGKDNELFNQISDWSRLSIVIPNYASAPKVVDALLSKFSGKLSLHERDEYKAIHLHSNYKDVNFEIQVHTEECLKLKQATDLFYHKYVNSNIESNSTDSEDYQRIDTQIKACCKAFYARTDFDQYLPEIKAVEKKYRENSNESFKPTQNKLSTFCECYSKAYKVQKELEQYITKYIEQVTKQEKIQGGEK